MSWPVQIAAGRCIRAPFGSTSAYDVRIAGGLAAQPEHFGAQGARVPIGIARGGRTHQRGTILVWIGVRSLPHQPIRPLEQPSPCPSRRRWKFFEG
jgi:hypothetical protein